MGPIIRTCRLAAAALGALGALGLIPATAQASVIRSGASTFVAARAAANAGDSRRAAILYASLAMADPADRVVANRALAQAILAGDMRLALRLARARPPAGLAADARLLLIADELKAGRLRSVIKAGLPPELTFLGPFLEAWSEAERGDWRGAVALLDKVSADSPLAVQVPEQKALILLGAGRIAEAQPLIAASLPRAGGRTERLRVTYAMALARAGDRAAAAALLQGRDVTLRTAADLLASETRAPAPSSATPAQRFAETLAGLAIALNAGEETSLPLALAQIARFADPGNDQGAVLLGLLLGRAGRSDDALAVLRTISDRAIFASEAHDSEIRVLLQGQRRQEALARAQAFVSGASVTADDWSRLGDVFDVMGRHGEAADAFARALALVERGGPGSEPWSLQLMRGAALEQAGRWAEGERALEAAYALAPDNPVVLNYLGYARLERGEQLDEAEALIAEASRRAPDDASITDSLGWAQYKRGKYGEAIATLERAAAADPGQAEIHEHLGDALYSAGRKFEARFAWSAALVAAEDDVRKRVEAKLASGLSKATAAP